MATILISGIHGFVGKHLATYLHRFHHQIYGFDLQSKESIGNVTIGDLTDSKACEQALNKSKAKVIFHLAGLLKSEQPETLYKVNVLGTLTLFESIIKLEQKPLVIIASSSAVYGAGGKIIDEYLTPQSKTHYAISKLTQENIALHYFYTHQIPVIIVRMFNVLGPGQSPDLACSAFAKQIALAEINDTKEIVTGNLEALRDFVDVRDAVRAFEMIAEHGTAGEIYNVCSGKAVSLKECLDEMMSQSKKQLSVKVDAEKFQKNDVPVQIGSYQKINKVTGWCPKIFLKESLTDLLNDWRERVKVAE